MHLPAAGSAHSVSTCGWYSWSLEHTDGSHSTFPEALHRTRAELYHQLGGADPSHNETGETKLPMAYIKNLYGMRKHKDRKTTQAGAQLLISAAQNRKERICFF